MRLNGELTTADQADPLAVQSALTASQADRRLDIEWHHGAAGLSHGFRIGDIRRDGEPAPVTLRWDGEPLAVEESGERQYPVPAEGAFQVIAARTLSYPQPHIRVQFSQPLMGSQDTTGLVRVDGEEARVRIDGSQLLVLPRRRSRGRRCRHPRPSAPACAARRGSAWTASSPRTWCCGWPNPAFASSVTA